VAGDANQSGQGLSDGMRRRANVMRLHRRARTTLAAELDPGEEPRLVIKGLGETAVIGTDARAFVFKTGVTAGLPFSSRLKMFEYESIMRVDLRPAGEIDVVVIHAPLKIASCSSYWVDARDNAWKARNAIPVARGAAGIEEAVAELSRLVAVVRERTTVGRPPAPRVAEQITAIEQEAPRLGLASVKSTESAPPSQESSLPSGPAFEDCPRCGNRLRIGWKFCPRCGAPAEEDRPRRAAGRRRRRLT
jgi:zinc-ribbon domain